MVTSNPTFQLCADFTLFPENTPLAPTVAFAAYQFRQLGGSTSLIVLPADGEKGLRFPPQGLEITLPAPVTDVVVRLLAGAGPLDIAAVDGSGTTIWQHTLPGISGVNNVPVDVPISTPERFTSVVLTYGGNEGYLIKVCTTIRLA